MDFREVSAAYETLRCYYLTRKTLPSIEGVVDEDRFKYRGAAAGQDASDQNWNFDEDDYLFEQSKREWYR